MFYADRKQPADLGSRRACVDDPRWQPTLPKIARKAVISSTLLAAALVSSISHAADAPTSAEAVAPAPVLPAVTVSGTRTENPVDEVTATVTVIPARVIEQRLVQDIRDLTRYEPNVSVGNSPTRFGLTGINIRGIEGNRILMQVDGVRLPDSFSIGSFAFATRDTIDVDLLKSVEILRGPGSSLYGSDALGGVVSYFTKDPADFLRETKNDLYASLKATGNQVGHGRMYSATLAGGRDWPLQLLLSGIRRVGSEMDNFGTVDSRGPSRTKPNPQTASSTNGLVKLVWNAKAGGPQLRLTLESRDATSNTDVATLNSLSPKTTLLTANDSAKRERVAADVDWTNLGFVDTLRANVYRQDSKTRQRTLERRDATTAGCSGVTTGTNTCFRQVEFAFDQDVSGFSVQGLTLLSGKSFAQRVSYGLDYSRTRFEQSRDGLQTILTAAGKSTSSPTVGADIFPVRDFPISVSKQTGVYLQDEIFLLDGALTVTPGIRYDQFKLSPELDGIYSADNPGVAVKGLRDSAVSPRMGLLWKVLPQLAIYAQYAQGFRAPPYSDVNFGFTNFAFGYTAIANPSLKPERSRGTELGLRGSGDVYSYSLVAFSNRYTDFISSLTQLNCPGDPRCSTVVPITFQSVNIGRVKITGWEAKASWRLDAVLKGLALIASTGESKGDNLIDNTPLDSVDPRKTVVGLKYDAPSKTFGLEGILTNHAAKTRVASTTQFMTPAANVVDLLAYWNPLTNLQLNAGLFNVTDRKYWQWSDVRGVAASSTVLDRFTQPGRNLSVSVKLTF